MLAAIVFNHEQSGDQETGKMAPELSRHIAVTGMGLIGPSGMNVGELWAPLDVDHSHCGPGCAIGIKNVSINEPYFQGHFPVTPIMPGVLVTESVLQTSAFMRPSGQSHDSTEDSLGKQYFCIGFNMKFKLSVVPGDQLRTEVRLVRQLVDMTRVMAVVKSKQGMVAAGDVSLAVINPEISSVS